MKIFRTIEKKLSQTPFLIRILLPVCWYAFICYLTNQPIGSGASTEKALQKINMEQHNVSLRSMAHLLFFGILAILIYISLYTRFNFNMKYFGISLLCIIVLGGIDEIHQLYIPGRHPRLVDVLKDFLGSVLSLGVLFLIFKTINSSDNHPGKQANDPEHTNDKQHHPVQNKLQ